jgi:signal transduction histidine kinase
MLSHQLVPVTFYEDALITSMERLLKVTNIENKYKITIHYDQLDSVNLDNQLQLNLYRILQEQLQNIIKHADASMIEVSIRLQGNMLHMRIYDNGKGFDSKLLKGSGGIGLQNIRNRVETFFGSFSINSVIGHGCELLIKVPVEKLNR